MLPEKGRREREQSWFGNNSFACHANTILQYVVSLTDLVVFHQALLLSGVPHWLRSHVWVRATSAAALRAEASLRYDQLVGCAFAQLEGSVQMSEVGVRGLWRERWRERERRRRT